jgi:hypothetical protein
MTTYTNLSKIIAHYKYIWTECLLKAKDKAIPS